MEYEALKSLETNKIKEMIKAILAEQSILIKK